MNIFVDDARKHLATFDKKYDIVILDAYAANYVPYHLMTDEFFEILGERMEPDGVVVSNVIGSIEGQNSQLARAIYKTMKETFPISYIFPTENFPTNIQNIMIVSSKNPYEFDRITLLELSKNSPADYLVDDLSKQNHFYEGTMDTSNVPFLTDQLNPSEVLTNPLTNKSYTQESQDNQIEKKEYRNDSINLGIGIVLSIVAAIWSLYFRKKIWHSDPVTVKKNK